MSRGTIHFPVVSRHRPTTIWKRVIERKRDEDETVVELEGFVRPLSVGVQGDKLVIWYEANPKVPMQTIELQVRGTGHQMFDNEGWFLGTCQLPRCAVVHVYFSYLS